MLAGRPEVRLALFDLAMPGMGSPSNLAAVRECHPAVTTVVVSGSLRREDVFLSLKAGVHGFVSKGTSIEELVQALRMILDGYVYVPAFVTQIEAAADGRAGNPSGRTRTELRSHGGSHPASAPSARPHRGGTVEQGDRPLAVARRGNGQDSRDGGTEGSGCAEPVRRSRVGSGQSSAFTDELKHSTRKPVRVRRQFARCNAEPGPPARCNPRASGRRLFEAVLQFSLKALAT